MMENENRIQENEIIEDMSQDYLNTIAELKRNSVSKDDYNKLKAENKNLLQTLVENGQIQTVEEKTPVDINKLRNELFSEDCDLSNLEYVKKSLELRDALIEAGEADPFLPVSSKNAPTIEEITKANNVAEAFRSCVEYADGDSEIFTQELMRITNDSNPMSGRRR